MNKTNGNIDVIQIHASMVYIGIDSVSAYVGKVFDTAFQNSMCVQRWASWFQIGMNGFCQISVTIFVSYIDA